MADFSTFNLSKFKNLATIYNIILYSFTISQDIPRIVSFWQNWSHLKVPNPILFRFFQTFRDFGIKRWPIFFSLPMWNFKVKRYFLWVILNKMWPFHGYHNFCTMLCIDVTVYQTCSTRTHTRTRTRVRNCVPIPVPMGSNPYPYPYPWLIDMLDPYPYPWSRIRTRTHIHGLVPVAIPIPMGSYPYQYPYPYPYPWSHGLVPVP